MFFSSSVLKLRSPSEFFSSSVLNIWSLSEIIKHHVIIEGQVFLVVIGDLKVLFFVSNYVSEISRCIRKDNLEFYSVTIFVGLSL